MSQGFTKGTPIDTDPTLSLNSDIVVPSQKAIKSYLTANYQPIGAVVTYERKSDYVFPYQYSGTAPVGTLDSGSWTIKRVDFTTPGSPITLQATGAWTNRYSLTYV